MGLSNLFKIGLSQEDLVNEAKYNKSNSFRCNVMKQINNKYDCHDIVRYGEYSDTRMMALEKITDQKMLADIVKNWDINSFSLRAAALEKITDVEFIADVAKNCINHELGSRATEKINDCNLLLDIANDAKLTSVKQNIKQKLIFIIENCHNQQVLKNILKKSKSINIRRKVIVKIKDENILNDVAKNDSDIIIRREAIKKLTNTQILHNISENDKDSYTRQLASQRLSKITKEKIQHKKITTRENNIPHKTETTTKKITNTNTEKNIPNKSENSYKKIININNASQDELSKVPGISKSNASIIINMRKKGNYIKSYDDLEKTLQLQPFQTKEIQKHTHISSDESANSKSRQEMSTPDNIEKKDSLKKIDINTANKEQLAKLPGINIILATKIIQMRESGNYINSTSDLKDMLNLKDYQINQLMEHALIKNQSIPKQSTFTGRRLDI